MTYAQKTIDEIVHIMDNEEELLDHDSMIFTSGEMKRACQLAWDSALEWAKDHAKVEVTEYEDRDTSTYSVTFHSYSGDGFVQIDKESILRGKTAEFKE